MLLPRPTPCRRHHRKHENGRLYLVLLLLLAGDVELNPGPAHVQESTANNGKIQGAEDTERSRCSLCNVMIESYMLRSRVVEDAVHPCEVADCTSVVHHHCVNNGRKCRTIEWTCARHAQPSGELKPVEHQSLNATVPVDVPARPSCTEPEPIPGPSFASASMMDVMEALQLTQLKLNQVSSEVAELRKAFQTVLSQNDYRQMSAPAAP